jgi:hypothetical protein
MEGVEGPNKDKYAKRLGMCLPRSPLSSWWAMPGARRGLGMTGFVNSGVGYVRCCPGHGHWTMV